MKEWIPIDSYKDLPLGNWLVQLTEQVHGSDVHVATVRGNEHKIVVVAGVFDFDAPKPIAYREIPS